MERSVPAVARGLQDPRSDAAQQPEREHRAGQARDREAEAERRHVGDQQHERHGHEQARHVLRRGDRGGAPGEAEAEHARGAHAARAEQRQRQRGELQQVRRLGLVEALADLGARA